MKIPSFFIAVLLVYSDLHADVTQDNVTIKNIRNGSDANNPNRVTFQINESAIDPASCGSSSYYELTDTDSKNSRLSILLTALTTSKKVTLEIEDKSGECSPYGKPLVKFVTIKS